MKRILVVCTGNICRSPMVKALLERQLEEAGWGEQVKVESAGTWAVVGAGASAGSVEAMVARGIDLTDHRGRQLDVQQAERSDLILVMEEAHRRAIFNNWPRMLRKTYLLSEMAGENDDIDDPYGGPQADYDAAAIIIEDYVRRGLPGILQRLGLSGG